MNDPTYFTKYVDVPEVTGTFYVGQLACDLDGGIDRLLPEEFSTVAQADLALDNYLTEKARG